MKRCAIGCVLVWLSATAFAQQRGAPPPPATETTAPNIPGVVAGGTKVQVIKEGFQGTEGPIGLPDGSLIFTETNASRITKIDKDNNTSTYLENTNGSNGLAFDARGRLISVQTGDGQRLGTIPVSRAPQNIAFAGPNKKTRYIVGRGAAYKVQLLAQGYTGRAK